MNEFMKSIIVENNEEDIQNQIPRMLLPNSHFPIFGTKNQQNQNLHPQTKLDSSFLAKSGTEGLDKKMEYVLSPFLTLSEDKKSFLFAEASSKNSK